MDEAILLRISRIYDAIGVTEEEDLNKLKAIVIQTNKLKGVSQDFRSGLSDSELSLQAHSVIHEIANLFDHLRKWAKHNGHEKTKIDETVKNCLELQIIRDLSDNDKHGYPPRKGGHSGKSPQLININRVMRLHTQAKKGSASVMTLGLDGIPKISGDGTAKAVVTGDVIDNDNNRIGDMYDIANIAVIAWEHLLVEFGLISSTNES